jgi:hypothetical protein
MAIAEVVVRVRLCATGRFRRDKSREGLAFGSAFLGTQGEAVAKRDSQPVRIIRWCDILATKLDWEPKPKSEIFGTRYSITLDYVLESSGILTTLSAYISISNV